MNNSSGVSRQAIQHINSNVGEVQANGEQIQKVIGIQDELEKIRMELNQILSYLPKNEETERDTTRKYIASVNEDEKRAANLLNSFLNKN